MKSARCFCCAFRASPTTSHRPQPRPRRLALDNAAQWKDVVHEALHAGVLLILLDRLEIIGDGAPPGRACFFVCCGRASSAVLSGRGLRPRRGFRAVRWMEGLVDFLSISGTLLRDGAAAPSAWERLQVHVSFNNRVRWGE